jgi:hypothetical protein
VLHVSLRTALRLCLCLSRKYFIAQAEKLANPAGVGAGVPNLKGAALGKFPDQPTDVFLMGPQSHFVPPRTFICSGLRVPVCESCLKRSSDALGDKICAGVFARRVE